MGFQFGSYSENNRSDQIMCLLSRIKQAIMKDNFPLPNIEMILQQVVGSQMMSLLDGFSGYNQIKVKGEDKFKTTFITHWGTLNYEHIPSGLI